MPTPALSCPECGQPALARAPTVSTATGPVSVHVDGRPMCLTAELGRPMRAWPVDAATAPAAARPGMLARPVRHPCRAAGTVIPVNLLAVGPVIVDADGPIDCAATAATGGCPWRSNGPDPSGTPVAVPAQRGCWLDATTVQSIVVTLSRAGRALPYTVTGLTPGYLDPNRCVALAGWLHRHTYDYPANAGDVPLGRSLFTISYASRWLIWAAEHGGIRVLSTDGGPPRQDRRRPAGPHPTAPAVPAPPATAALLTAAADPASPADPRCGEILTLLPTAGDRDGTNAAGWWAQDSVGGRATGDVAATARRVLAGIDEGDPLVLDTLPTPHALHPSEAAEMYHEATGDDAPEWDSLGSAQRPEAIDAYDQSAADRATWHCRTASDASAHPGP